MSENWPSPLAVRPSALRRQVESLINRGFKALTFSKALSRESPEPAFAITFDDAYRSVVTRGLPVLGQLGVPATVFAPTRADHAGIRHWRGISEWSESKWRSELAGASWRELADLRESGWEIGSHTRTHPDLRSLDDDALRSELEGSRLDCEAALGSECSSLAYPYGLVDERVASAARQAGYSAAAALDVSDRSASRDGRLSWPRLSVYRADSAARFWVKWVAFTRLTGAFGLVQSLRR